MAVVTDDLAFLRHHAVAALGTSVKELLCFICVGRLIHFFADFKKRGERSDDGLVLFFVHVSRLTRLFQGLNRRIWALIKARGRFKLHPRLIQFFRFNWGVDKR